MISRADRGAIADWWWTIDRTILAACLLLMGFGVMLSFATSPAITARIGVEDSFHFARQQIMFAIPALITMIMVSFFSPPNIKRFCLLLFVASFILMIGALMFGMEIKGARRWLNLGFTSLQPSEFVKPAFIVMTAWLFASQSGKAGMKGFLASAFLYLCCALTLVMQKDIGQTMLISATWAGVFFLAGMPLIMIVIFIALAVVGSFGAYMTFHHVHERVNDFLSGEKAFQTEVGEKAILNGSWLGQGPGEGTVKKFIPDSHTDFVFSVAAEEYGVILCILIVLLFGYIVIRSMRIAMSERDPFKRYAVSGIAMIFGLQSIINMAVNLHLMPPKGMTLPFISYGGSSFVAIAISMGILLSLTRRRPEARLSASMPSFKPVHG